MHTTLFIIGALACPLGMFALAGIAWVSTKVFPGRAPRLASAASRVSCMHHGHHGEAKSESRPEPLTAVGDSR